MIDLVSYVNLGLEALCYLMAGIMVLLVASMVGYGVCDALHDLDCKSVRHKATQALKELGFGVLILIVVLVVLCALGWLVSLAKL